MMNVNLTTPFIFCQAFAKNCKKYNTKGSIINVSSMVGIIGAKKPGYAASRR
jgi:NAD(P)-dependent dehydrogenase (short-subunit alcohol dehydrogenase family)